MPGIEVLPLATYYMIMSITPGPNNVMLASSGANFGFSRTAPHIGGIVFGCAAQTYALCLGLGVIFTAFPWLQTVMKWVGATYLLYLGWKLIGARTVNSSKVTSPITFVEAALFQLVNPKAWVKAITTTTLFLPPGTSPWLAGLWIFTVCTLVNFTTASVWTLFGVGIGKLLTNDRRRTLFNSGMAVLLSGTALLVVW
jgi:threonine/homoserine/homoserine lactone efflux protein